MKKLLIACGLVSGLSGCAVHKDWMAVDGSRAEGTVELAYFYGSDEKAKVDNEQGRQEALKRCQAWGFEATDPFVGIRKSCKSTDLTGRCHYWQVSQKYQCTGGVN